MNPEQAMANGVDCGGVHMLESTECHSSARSKTEIERSKKKACLGGALGVLVAATLICAAAWHRSRCSGHAGRMMMNDGKCAPITYEESNPITYEEFISASEGAWDKDYEKIEWSEAYKFGDYGLGEYIMGYWEVLQRADKDRKRRCKRQGGTEARPVKSPMYVAKGAWTKTPADRKWAEELVKEFTRRVVTPEWAHSLIVRLSKKKLALKVEYSWNDDGDSHETKLPSTSTLNTEEWYTREVAQAKVNGYLEIELKCAD